MKSENGEIGLFQKAKDGLNETWRYATGLLMIFFGWQTIGSLPIFALIGYVILKGGKISGSLMSSLTQMGISKNFTFSLILLSFVISCGILYVIVRYFHRKKFLSLITSREHFAWKRAGFGFALWLSMWLLAFGYSYYSSPEEFSFHFEWNTFFPLLLLCLFLLPFQTSFEELLFRGYLTQGVGLITGSRLLALLVPAITFGLLHSFNPEVFRYGFWVMMPFYIGMGIFLGILTLMDEGMELSLGVHFANNLTAALFVTMDSSALQTDALFRIKSYNPIDEIPFSLATMAIFLLITSLIFKWKDWGKLYRKI